MARNQNSPQRQSKEASNKNLSKDEKYKRRKARSQAMLEKGYEPVKDGYNEYFIPSQSNKRKKYKITIEDGWYSCECPDNQKGNLCKHILFLKTWFAIKLNEEEKDQQIDVSNPCPACESKNIIKDGTRKTKMGKKQKWLCKDCNKRFVNTPIKKSKGNVDTVITTIDLYMKGVSYRGIADSLEQFYGLQVSHVTVMNWVNKYMQKINNYVEGMHPETSDTWHADEQMINVKGKYQYVWNVMDTDTRFLLANHVSPSRTSKDADKVFKDAIKTADKKAKKVITDGAFAYEKPVRKNFWTYQNRDPHHRYVSLREKDSSNNKIERYHGTFRQRDKVMKGFGGNQKQHAENFRTYYNFIKEHSSLGMTPSQKAGINQKGNWKELLIKAINQ